jgi:hypothetical protein
VTLEEDDFALLLDLSLSGFEDEDEAFPLLEDETFLLLLDLLRELEDFAELLLDSSRSSLRELEELVAIFLLLLESSQSSQMDEDESSSRGATLLSSSPQAENAKARQRNAMPKNAFVQANPFIISPSPY